MACVVSPDASVAIRHVLFSPEACTAIWLMLFILPNATVAKWHVMFMCCLSSPNTSEAIRLAVFCLMPPWLYGLCCLFCLMPLWLNGM